MERYLGQSSPKWLSILRRSSLTHRIILPAPPVTPTLAQRSNSGSTITCFRCGRSGHVVADCFATKTVDGQPLESNNAYDLQPSNNQLQVTYRNPALNIMLMHEMNRRPTIRLRRGFCERLVVNSRQTPTDLLTITTKTASTINHIIQPKIRHPRLKHHC